MAKKLKAEAKPSGGIPAEELKRIMKEHDRQRTQAQEYNGRAGQAIKTAIDNFTLNAKALKMVLSMNRMEPTKRADFLRSFMEYAHKAEFFDQTDAFDDVVDTMEAIVSEIRARGEKPVRAGVDPIVSATVQ